VSTPVVIGIGAALERARWAAWDRPALLSPRSYTRTVQRNGALALVLSPDDAVAERPDDLLDMLDGLLLAGGSDLDPASYGADPHPETYGWNAERDRFEVALARTALERDLPVLGVCRGMQTLNVALGGTVNQHVEGVELHRETPGQFCDHDIALEPGSLAARAAGAEHTTGRSHHHQGLGELAEGLVVTGRSVPDGLVEAVELPDRRFALGVLWHPEEDERSRVVSAFVDASRGV
jgi:putative glutamine amidotransferase